MPDIVSRLAPAKLNLALHVTGRRDDGYHVIDSMVAFADFGDIITVSAAERDEFVVTGHYAPLVPINDGNLVLAARALLRSHFRNKELPPVHIRLEKRLPVAAGVGGGSSDAAAALKALAQFWDVAPDPQAFAAQALTLGADVPMCIAARPLVAGGVGETLEPLQVFPKMDAVLVNPGLPVATHAVFAALQQRNNAALPRPPRTANAAELAGYLAATRNDLQSAATTLCPPISEAIECLRTNGAVFARMSGSGATCFGLFTSTGAARHAADIISKQQPGWFVEACRIMGTQDDDGN